MNDFTNKIIQGNNLDILSLFSNNSIDSFITDVPYALSDIDPLKMIKDGVNNKSGFMNASWDCLPTVEMLKEFYRVLKTGGVFVTTFTPRQDLQTVFIYRLMEAGFDVSFSPIFWAYKSGFPKASNMQKTSTKHLTNNIYDIEFSINKYIEKCLKQEHSTNAEFVELQCKLGMENCGVIILEEQNVVPNVICNILSKNQKRQQKNVTDVELQLQDVNQASKSKTMYSIVVSNAKKQQQQLLLTVQLVELKKQNQEACAMEKEFSVLSNVLTLDLEKILHKIKEEEVLKTESGKDKFLLQEILNAFYAEVIESLKPIILSQLKHTQNYDTIYQMVCAFAINVIITKSTMECLITSTVNTLVIKLKEKQGQMQKYIDGLYSLSLKPAVEPIIICQKPHGKAKYKQALDWYYERKELLDKGIPEEDLSLYTKNASGGAWIDNGRIPINNIESEPGYRPNRINHNTNQGKNSIIGVGGNNFDLPDCGTYSSDGRFPANLLCGFPVSKEELRSEYPDATEEELDKMINMIENPLDVGRVSKSGGGDKRSLNCGRNNFLGEMTDKQRNVLPLREWENDAGDLSRYFSLTAWSKKHFPNLHNVVEKTLQLQEDVKKTGDCLFVCKPAQSEKNAGLEGQNKHVCVKPISLYNYLITLFSKEGDIILDPFCGSGVTPIACVLTNRKYIGIEMSEEYHKIAEARVEYWKKQKEGVKIPYASKKNVSASKNIDTKQEILI